MLFCKRLFVLVAVVLLLNGCVVVQSKVSEDKTPNPDSAYLYGNFRLITTDNVGLSIILQEYDPKQDENEASMEYFIGFNKIDTGKVDLIEIPPGLYNINGMLNLQKDTVGYAPRGRSKLFKTPDPIVITLQAGKAYYLGDYTGTSSVYCSYQSCRYNWRLTSIENTMEKSTQVFKEHYNSFQKLSAISLLPEIIGQLKTKVSTSE